MGKKVYVFNSEAEQKAFLEKWSYNIKKNGLSVGLKEFLTENEFDASDLNRTNKDGCTPLTLALKTGDSFAAQELIKHSVDVNLHDKNDNNPLELTYEILKEDRGFEGTYNLLIDRGAHDRDGSIAEKGTFWREVEKILLGFEAEVDEQADEDSLKTSLELPETKLRKDTVKIEDYFTRMDRLIRARLSKKRDIEELRASIKDKIKNKEPAKICELLQGIMENFDKYGRSAYPLISNGLAVLPQLNDAEKSALFQQLFTFLGLPDLKTSPERELQAIDFMINEMDFSSLTLLLQDSYYNELFEKMDYQKYKDAPLEIQCNLLVLHMRNQEQADYSHYSKFEKKLRAFGLDTTPATIFTRYIYAPDVLDFFTKSEHFDADLLKKLLWEYGIKFTEDTDDEIFILEQLMADLENRDPVGILMCLERSRLGILSLNNTKSAFRTLP